MTENMEEKMLVTKNAVTLDWLILYEVNRPTDPAVKKTIPQKMPSLTVERLR